MSPPHGRKRLRHSIIVSEFVSLDGVVEAPGGEAGHRHTGWTFDIEQDPTMYEYKLTEAREAEALPAGSGTLVHGLSDAGLVDEWRLMVFP